MTDQDSPQDTPLPADWEALARFVAGQAAPAERAEQERQLARDPRHRALVHALDDVLRVAEPAPPSADEVEAALALVIARREEPRPAAAPRRAPAVSLDAYRARWLGARMRAAAAVLVVAGAGLVWKSVSSRSELPPTAAQARYSTQMGSLDSLQLPDGTRVLLGPASELVLRDGFGGASREMTLKGDARFDVVHDASRPFVVHTDAATFTDIGTIFSVHSHAGNGARVVVTEGVVSVLGRTQSAPTTLNAGDRATISAEGAVTAERAAATSDDVAWTTGKLVFRDAPIAQVTGDIRRWYGLELRVDSGLPTERLNVTFDRAAAASVGHIVAAMLGGELRDSGGVLHIKVKGTPVLPK